MKLVPYARNARTHSEAQVAQIAGSIREFGFTNPVLIDAADGIIAGHGRVMAARALGLSEVPCIRLGHLTETQRRAYVLADNRIALNSGWDADMLALELTELKIDDFDLSMLGFDVPELDELLNGSDDLPGMPTEGSAKVDEVPEPPAVPVSRMGDIWQLGDHRILCGDSTEAAGVSALLVGNKAQLVHADPPYGMSKEAEGVLNDNLHRHELDAFQMAWWRTFRPHLTDNASAYIWGTAPDLWRLWYGGLSQSERMTIRNEVVWDKVTGMGMSVSTHRQFPTATERCLFFMLGDQAFGNANKEDYWEGFEPIRGYLAEQADIMGWGAREVNQICGVGMFGHWCSKSQWNMIPERHYLSLQAAANGAGFNKPYAELRRLYDGKIVNGEHLAAKHQFDAARAFFDNAHDNMTDVWHFPRVIGAERHGHATPKPVDMTARCLKSSCPDGGLVLEPFSGSGTTIIAAEMTGRRCYAVELNPAYVDVAVRRWQDFTGREATLEGDGRTFDQLAEHRIKP